MRVSLFISFGCVRLFSRRVSSQAPAEPLLTAVWRWDLFTSRTAPGKNVGSLRCVKHGTYSAFLCRWAASFLRSTAAHVWYHDKRDAVYMFWGLETWVNFFAVISGFRRGVNEVFFRLGRYAACVGSLLLTFRDSLLVPFSKRSRNIPEMRIPRPLYLSAAVWACTLLQDYRCTNTLISAAILIFPHFSVSSFSYFIFCF